MLLQEKDSMHKQSIVTYLLTVVCNIKSILKVALNQQQYKHWLLHIIKLSHIFRYT